MYRNDALARLTFETELYEVPSPRRETGAVWRVSIGLVALWVAGCAAFYFLLVKYKITFHTQPGDLMAVVAAALVPILFFPLLPVRSVVRRFFARARRSSVKVTLDGPGVTWTGLAMSRHQVNGIDCCLLVRMEPGLHIVVATRGMDAPFLLRVPNEGAAQRLAVDLEAGKSDVGAIAFPVWTGREHLSILTGKEIRVGQSLKRMSLALLCGGFTCAMVITRLISQWLQMGVFIFLGLPALLGVFYLFLVSWSALLDEPPAGNLTIDASKICLDGALLCFLTDHITLRIVDGPVLEIEASRILNGKRLIKPWQVGDLHELELIRATIEAYQAQASKDALG